MRRLMLFAVLILFAAGCGAPAATEAPPDVAELLHEAADNIRARQSFRMIVERSGMEYIIDTDLGSAVFNRASVQYAAPDAMQATVRVRAAGLPLDLDFLFRGENQWLRGIWTSNLWVKILFAPGFSPAALLAETTGFQAAIQALSEMRLVGSETLVDGTPVWHVAASAEGSAVSAFMAGLIEVTGRVIADVYIHRETRLPVRFVIVQPDTAADAVEPTTWTIEVFGFDEAAVIADPEATPEP